MGLPRGPKTDAAAMSAIDGLDLGEFGIWTFDLEHLSAAAMREAVEELITSACR
jgi:hypothetical protein